MQLAFDTSLLTAYKSPAQQIRVMSESWIAKNMYCVKCGEPHLQQSKNNTPVGDFYCPSCREVFELKSTKSNTGHKITDGAFSVMMDKIKNNCVPNFLYLHYHPQNYEVHNLIAIPKYYFTAEIIEKRLPLATSARRAGWVGCNINLAAIPNSGKLYLIKEKIWSPKEHILKNFNKMLFLHRLPIEPKGWLLDIIQCIESLQRKTFSLQDLYLFEEILKVKHPKNYHIQEKIRQQLQILRDFGYLIFLKNGQYQLL